MAESVEQLWGQTFSNGTAAQVWLFAGFEGTEDVDGRIKQFLPDEVPLVWAGLPIDTNWDVRELGGRVYTVTVRFSAKAGPILDPTADETGDAPDHGGEDGAATEPANNISFDVRTGTQKVFQSLQTVQSAAVGTGDGPGGFAVARNFGRAMAVKESNGSFEVEGFDVLGGEGTWTLKGKIPAYLVTGAYVTRFQNLFCPRPRMCDKAFFGYHRGEVLILTGSISEMTSNGFRDVTVTFGVKFNRPMLTFSASPLLELYDVGGWNVTWCTYKEQTQTIAGATRKALLPFEAFEERVYEYGDFDDLKVKKFKKVTVTP